MHRLVPQFIQEQYAAGQMAGSFDAGALFVDISGFTAITDAIMGHGQHGAEVLAGIIQDIFDPLVQSVFEHGGFVTNFAGDAFTAVFKVRHDATSAANRALASAWRMQQVMAGSAQCATPYGTFTMSVKVGLAFGTVAWGVVSSTDDSRAVYYFQGLAIDACAAAQKLARSGDVVVDAAIYKLLEPLVSAEPVADHFRIAAVSGDLPDPQPITLGPVEPVITGRFFPSEATQESLSGEFRQVANMFISLPTVQTVEQLEIFMQTIFDLQDRYGGLLNRLAFGDKGANLLLFWGAPVAHENDLARALNFIIDLQSLTAVPVNAGITYAIAHGGYSGGKLTGEYTCHGRGTTLAARFMEASPRGEVWVDEHVAERAKHHFEVDLEGEMTFKGFAEPQKVFVLLERKEASEPFYEGQTIGRQTERAQLAGFVRPLWQGKHPGAMVVSGEPGIGKSRLIHAFLSDLEENAGHDCSVFVCQTDEILRESLNPMRYWLRRYFNQSEGQSDARNKRSFNRKLDRLIATTQDQTLVAELDRTRSFLGALVNLHWPDSLYEQLDAQGRYENTFIGLLTLLQAESSHQPVVLILEDAHWFDGDSISFLHFLLRELSHSRAYPLAVIAASRTERNLAAFGPDISHQEIILDQITPSDQALLAAGQLGAPISSDLHELLVERAEGNPFFGEQILRYLQEQDLLLQVEGKWHLRTGQEAALPADVRAVLVARLDRLAQDVREVVQTASVLGREFEIQLLSRMLHGDPGLKEKVAQAEDMFIWSALSELRYLFKHTLLRDAAYHMQVHARRRSLHRLAAEAMESLYADDLEPHYGEVAYHAEQAQLIDDARHYLEVAGQTARDAYQNSMSLDYYSRALKLTPDEDLESRYRLLSATESICGRIGAQQDQAQALNEMTDLADQLQDGGKQIKVLIRRSWLLWWLADYDGSLAASQQASIMAGTVGRDELVAEADQVSAWSMIQKGHYVQARRHAEKALAAARQSGNADLERNALHILGFIYRTEGDFYAGRQVAQEALAISRDMEGQHGVGTALGNLGVAHMTLGEYAAANKCFRQALVIGRETGNRITVVSGLINLSWHAQTLGQWEPAIAFAEEGIAIVHGLKQTEMEAEGLIWLGHGWLGLGQPEKAMAAYRDSLRLRRDLDQENLAMGVLAGMARAAVAQDDLESALGFVTEILSFLDDGGSLDGTWEPLRLYLTCYQVLTLTGDPRVGEILETAYQKLQRWAARIPDAETRRTYLEEIPWHRELVSVYRDIASAS